MTFFKTLFFILLTLSLISNSYATEIIGGSLRYEALGNEQYKIIGTINRNCSGPALGMPVFSIYSGSASFTLNVTRTSIKDITFNCNTITPPCSPSNTQTANGQEQHTFESIVDFSIYPFYNFYDAGNCEVMFSMGACCKSSKTTTITANDFYIEAMLNLCTLGKTMENSNTSVTPTTYIGMCINYPFTYSFGYNEKDGDSLLHTFETPMKGKNSLETFINPFSAQHPMTPFCVPPGVIDCKPLPNAKPPRGLYFDNNTGDIIVTPTDINERAVFDIRTTEYRIINNIITKIGYSTTELFIEVRNCTDNNPPFIPTKYSWAICEGNKLCFTIQSRDTRTAIATLDDTTFLAWNYGIPAATCRIIDSTAREKQAEFCWQTKIGDAKPYEYQFIATTTDRNCDQPLVTSKSFVIRVKPIAKAKAKYKKLAGNTLVFESNSPDSLKLAYEWRIRDSFNTKLLYYSNKQKDTFVFSDTGIYYMNLIANFNPNNCPTTYIDTIHMDGKITASVNSISVNTIRIYPNPTNGFINIDLDKNKIWTGMKLINSIGQVIYIGPANPVFDMSRYAAGSFTIELISKDEKYVASIIKE